MRGNHRPAFASAWAASPTEAAAELVASAVVALHRGDADDLDHCLTLLADGPGGVPARLVMTRAIAERLQGAVEEAWRHGWQPTDLARIVDRRSGPVQARMVVDAIAARLRAYAPATVDEQWDAQLRDLDAVVWWPHDDRYLDRFAERHDLDRAATVRCAVEALHAMSLLPAIPALCPVPGAGRRGSLAAGQRPDTVGEEGALDRIRALLAKAESTGFPSEAEALTAKAQDLMARHSIDYALLAVRTGGGEQPRGVRVGIDSPYEAAKALLLQEVADANRCRTMWSKELGFATVLGFPADLEAVDLLYTSLRVQGTAAMMRAGARQDAGGQTRTRSFRQSFLNAYAVRIGQRLHEASEQASAEAVAAAADDRLLPVLAARDDEVRAMLARLFPESVSRRVTATDREGWVSGTAAADGASLHARRAVGSR